MFNTISTGSASSSIILYLYMFKWHRTIVPGHNEMGIIIIM